MSTNDRAAARRVAPLLRGAGNEVVIVDDARAAIDLVLARAVDVVVADAADEAIEPLLDAARGHAPIVVLAGEAAPARMLHLVCDRGVEHVLAGEVGRELVVTVEKILRGDLFGIDKYLPGYGVDVSVSEVRGAADRDGVVECLVDHVEWLGAGREAARAVAAVADELITNAVYDAPRDAAGRPRYLHVDRKEKIVLEPWEYVTVRWASDGETLALSVTDAFGALRLDTVREGLRRCLADGDQIEQKEGGAGLGFYTALSYSTQLVVNVDRGEQTEIIALIDLRRRGAGARRAGRSLHLFFDDSRARLAVGDDAVPTSVVVSESMQIELRQAIAPSKRRAEVVALTHPKRRATTLAAGTAAPPVTEAVGLGATCALIRDARDVDAAITAALRFLAAHYDAAIAYAAGGERLDARLCEGVVRDWPRLRELKMARDSTASVVALASVGCAVTFRPGSPIDARLAMLATGDCEAAGITVPLLQGGDLRWILYGARPRDEGTLTSAMLDLMRRTLEVTLARLDPDEPEIVIEEEITQPERQIRGR